jgi:hypothetical protein
MLLGTTLVWAISCEPLNGAARNFNEFAGLFDFHLSRNQFFNRFKVNYFWVNWAAKLSKLRRILLLDY